MATPKGQPAHGNPPHANSREGDKYHKRRSELPPPPLEWWRHRLPAEDEGPLGDLYWSALMQCTIHHFRREVRSRGIPYLIVGKSWFVDASHLPKLLRVES